MFSAGAPLPADTARVVARVLGVPVTEAYGSSETGGIAWREDVAAPWRPFPGVTVAADDDGQLLLDSPLLASDSPRPLRCPDRIAVREDGRFDLLGRADDTVKVGGKRVSLGEVEERALARHRRSRRRRDRQASGAARGTRDLARGRRRRHGRGGPRRARSVARSHHASSPSPRRRGPSAGGQRKTPAGRLRGLFVPEAGVRDLDPDVETVHVDAAAATRTLSVMVPTDLRGSRATSPADRSLRA